MKFKRVGNVLEDILNDDLSIEELDAYDSMLDDDKLIDEVINKPAEMPQAHPYFGTGSKKAIAGDNLINSNKELDGLYKQYSYVEKAITEAKVKVRKLENNKATISYKIADLEELIEILKEKMKVIKSRKVRGYSEEELDDLRRNYFFREIPVMTEHFMIAVKDAYKFAKKKDANTVSEIFNNLEVYVKDMNLRVQQLYLKLKPIKYSGDHNEIQKSS